MTWWGMSYGFWQGIEERIFALLTQSESLKITKAALSQLHKISPGSRCTLFVSWFILSECLRNVVLLSTSHLMHPSALFSISEGSWEKNCWLLEGLTVEKRNKEKNTHIKKDTILDWCFHHIFPVPENNTSSLHYREMQNSHSLISSLHDRGEIKRTTKWVWESLVCSSQTAELLTGEFCAWVRPPLCQANSPDCCSTGNGLKPDKPVTRGTMLSHHPRALGSVLRLRNPQRLN